MFLRKSSFEKFDRQGKSKKSVFFRFRGGDFWMRKKIQIPVVIIKKLLFFGFEKCSKKVDEAEGGGPRRAHAKMLNRTKEKL